MIFVGQNSGSGPGCCGMARRKRRTAPKEITQAIALEWPLAGGSQADTLRDNQGIHNRFGCEQPGFALQRVVTVKTPQIESTRYASQHSKAGVPNAVKSAKRLRTTRKCFAQTSVGKNRPGSDTRQRYQPFRVRKAHL